jgi:hypothetical protein
LTTTAECIKITVKRTIYRAASSSSSDLFGDGNKIRGERSSVEISSTLERDSGICGTLYDRRKRDAFIAFETADEFWPG